MQGPFTNKQKNLEKAKLAKAKLAARRDMEAAHRASFRQLSTFLAATNGRRRERSCRAILSIWKQLRGQRCQRYGSPGLLLHQEGTHTPTCRASLDDRGETAPKLMSSAKTGGQTPPQNCRKGTSECLSHSWYRGKGTRLLAPNPGVFYSSKVLAKFAWSRKIPAFAQRWAGQLFIRICGRTVVFNARSDESIRAIKERIKGKGGRLVWAGRDLMDERTLGSYGVVKESTLDLRFRLLGGGPSEANSVAQKQLKLCMYPTALVRKGTFGGIALFDSTLEQQLGVMDPLVLRAMYAEHVLSSDSRESFSPPNHPDLICTPEGEFSFVAGKHGVDTANWDLKPNAHPLCAPGAMIPGRNAISLATLSQATEAKRAQLLPVEILALRLYSGPMYSKYNSILRSALAGGETPLNLYPTTIQVLMSAITKLSRIAEIPEGGAVFRGTGLVLPAEFFELDEQGFAGGVEPSFMSTTRMEQVARNYSGALEGSEATIFKLLVDRNSIGADISWASQFPDEAEIVFPPRTHLQVLRQEVSTDGISVVTLRPTTFQNVRTVQEVLSSRKEGLQHLARSLTWDLRNEQALTGKLDDKVAQELDELESKLLANHCRHDWDWYNDLVKYKGAFHELVREVGQARERITMGQDLDIASTLWGNLDVTKEGQSQAKGSEATATITAEKIAPSNDVSALHGKFILDPNFKGVRGKFGSQELFAAGVESVVGPMDVLFVRGEAKAMRLALEKMLIFVFTLKI